LQNEELKALLEREKRREGSVGRESVNTGRC
jgi:hypothetical protein